MRLRQNRSISVPLCIGPVFVFFRLTFLSYVLCKYCKYCIRKYLQCANFLDLFMLTDEGFCRFLFVCFLNYILRLLLTVVVVAPPRQ